MASTQPSPKRTCVLQMLAILMCLVPSHSPITSPLPNCSSAKAPHVGPGRLAELSGQRVATAYPAPTGMAPPQKDRDT
ncbi:hypothetical protein N7481_002148 [Penicillium waksmanii]|uniref:uncharacterized protein n=1 Tax=Penicillium waksmanii TaxID=69791 RepID=UPI002548A28F|nr:uncharacterized protein N7481_002148 [Penicillium waksmanii]KAJ5995171.1 hypothetical protein N7481_002148 [Penicillium waksmanii]